MPCAGGADLPKTEYVECEYLHFHSVYAIAILCLVSVWIGMHLASLALMYVKLRQKIILAGQPHYNAIIVVGNILCLACIILAFGDQTTFKCRAKEILVSQGFTMTYLTMALKAYRIDAIFNNKTLIPKQISEAQLIPVIMCGILFDWVLFLIQNQFEPTFGVDRMKEAWFGSYEMNVCTSSGIGVRTLTFAYKATVLIFATVYAYKTRRVSHEFSEARLLFSVIYTCALLGVIGTILTLQANLSSLATAAILAVFVLFCTMMNLVLILPRTLRAYGFNGFNGVWPVSVDMTKQLHTLSAITASPIVGSPPDGLTKTTRSPGMTKNSSVATRSFEYGTGSAEATGEDKLRCRHCGKPR